MKLIRLLILAAAATPQAMLAQPSHPQVASLSFTDATTRSNSNAGQSGCFWLQGGASELAVPLRSHFSAVADLGGAATPSVNAGTHGLSLITYTGGPRLSRSNRTYRPFAQVLAGGAYAFNSFFPAVRGLPQPTDLPCWPAEVSTCASPPMRTSASHKLSTS